MSNYYIDSSVLVSLIMMLRFARVDGVVSFKYVILHLPSVAHVMSAALFRINFDLYCSFCINHGLVADWPMGQNLFLMSHPDVSLVNILLSITCLTCSK